MDTNRIYTNALRLSNFFQMRHPVAFGEQKRKHTEIWKAFWAQPMSVKQKYGFTATGGYEYKDGQEYKENFHVSLLFEVPANATEIDKMYIQSAKELILASLPLVKSAAEVVSEVAEYDIVPDVMARHERWQLRDLHYFPRKLEQILSAGEELSIMAVPHVDKGLTIHFNEDEEGFEGMTMEEMFEAIVLEHNSILAYGGLDAQYYSMCRIIAMCHRVRATKRSEVKGRNATVLFAGFGNMKYDKQKHGRTQDTFSKGENYKLTYEQLCGMFIPEEEMVTL